MNRRNPFAPFYAALALIVFAAYLTAACWAGWAALFGALK